MKKHGITIRTIAVLFFALVVSSSVQAQERYHVSGSGDDANTCVRLSPCRTFQRAHDVAVSGNEIVVLDSAGYGPVNITKSISISGEGHYAGITVYGGLTGININSATAVVVIRNLHLHGLNGLGHHGILVTDAAAVHIENCVIQGFLVHGLLVSSSANAGLRTFIKNTVMRNSTVGATVGAGKAAFENCQFEKNTTQGVSISSGAKAIFHNCLMAGNSTSGLAVTDAGSRAMVDNCQFSNNTFGIATLNTAQIRVSNSSVTENGTGLSVSSGGTLLSLLLAPGVFTNTVEDNGVNGAFTGTYTAK